HGVIGPYDVSRTRPAPAISGVTSIGVAPVTLKIAFAGNPLTGVSLSPDMFSVTNGTIIPASIAPAGGDTAWTFQVQANGIGNVGVAFPQNQISDAYKNRNLATTAPYTLDYSDGVPVANFSAIDSIYFMQPTSISFDVSSGLGSLQLFRKDGITQITDATTAAGLFTINGSVPGSITFAPPHNTFTGSVLASPTDTYVIHISADTIRNELGSGIRDTSYTFKVYNFSLSHTSITFPPQNEGYPFAPEIVTISNNGSLTATDLTVTLSGTDATDFVVSQPAATLPGGSSTSFIVAPVTGLSEGTYTATVTVKSMGKEIDPFTVSFTVTRIPPPNAIIDYVNETFYNLSADTAYVFNGGSPVAPDDTGAVRIPESWMNGRANNFSAVDPEYGAIGAPQIVPVPLRPSAPRIVIQNVSAPNVNDGMITGVNDSMQYRTGETEEWIDVPTGVTRLDYLPPGIYQIRYKAIANKSFASHIAVETVNVPGTAILIRKVELPEMPDVIILPGTGFHYVNSGDYFLFTLISKGDKPPTVRTNRIIDGEREVLTGIPDGAGGYDYRIPAVREDILVEIEVHNTSAEAVDGLSVWAYGNAIRIASPKRTTADIYSVSGILLKRINIAPGISVVHAAPGIYIVVLPDDGATYKVTVK
ncbi:MAG: hypothetical protein LBP64_01150, partial [Tannerella sp.]|nr:hypothetical protein [Tannerella sp.]